MGSISFNVFILLGAVLFSLSMGAEVPGIRELSNNNINQKTRLNPLMDPLADDTQVKYQCWEPVKGLSHPVVTMVTIMLSHNEAQKFVRKNRLSYILEHGYRYCELNQLADEARIAAFSKIPFMLALLPCTDYAIHVDGDAILVNHALSFAPWLAHMQAKKVDMLFSADCITESPINFGMFALRPSPWLLKVFKELYNRCACDWSRLNDWPAEQGMIYDIMVEHMKAPYFHRAQIAKTDGWNRFPFDGYDGTNMLRKDDLIVHMTGIPKHKAEGDCGANATCKFEEIAKYYKEAVDDNIIPKPREFKDYDFRQTTCLPMHYKKLIDAKVTYNNRHDGVASSVLDWHTNQRGFISEITVGEIACLGYRDSKCDLKQYWDTKKGTGPWMPEHIEPLDTAPLDKQWQGRRKGNGKKHTRDPESEKIACKEVFANNTNMLCEEPCVDVAFLYHEDDKKMFVDNGVLKAARKHLKGVGKFFIISKSDATFKSLLDEQTIWVDEALAPFKPSDWEKRKSGRPTGWLYQQTLKIWAVRNLPGACSNVMFVDADTVWLKDFHVVTKNKGPNNQCTFKFKYNLSTMKSGAWEGDITNPEYHHFVEYITGLPKARANEVTAINHWQLMQRDVIDAMERSVTARHQVKSLHEAMVKYGLEYNGMSEYEAYFSFAWYFYQDRIDAVNLPYVMKDPNTCGYDDEQNKVAKEKSILMYFTCHDNYSGEGWYTNCKDRDSFCDPAREKRRSLQGLRA